MFKLVLEKAEEPEIKLPASAGSWGKQESSKKTSISALLTMPKPLAFRSLLSRVITLLCAENDQLMGSEGLSQVARKPMLKMTV